MTVTITAFDWVPDFAKGQVRDLRARWALEEVGQPYAVRYLSQGDQKQPDHRAIQPFGQVPTLEDGEVTLFESGAIVLYVAEHHGGLLPAGAAGRARATEWLFAALNTVEPPIMDLSYVDLFEADQPWSKPRRPAVVARIRERLNEASERLGDKPWFDSDFSVGDLMMVSVMRIIADDPLFAEFPNLVGYVARGTARPAFRRALDAQLAGFTGKPPPGFAQWLEKMKQVSDKIEGADA